MSRFFIGISLAAFVNIEVEEIINHIAYQSENKQSIQTNRESHSKRSSGDSSDSVDAVGVVVVAFPKLFCRIDFGSHFDTSAAHVFCDESVNDYVQQKVKFQVMPDKDISEKKRICGNFKEYELHVMLKELVTILVPERAENNYSDTGDYLLEADILPADDLYNFGVYVRI